MRLGPGLLLIGLLWANLAPIEFELHHETAGALHSIAAGVLILVGIGIAMWNDK